MWAGDVSVLMYMSLPVAEQLCPSLSRFVLDAVFCGQAHGFGVVPPVESVHQVEMQLMTRTNELGQRPGRAGFNGHSV